LQGFNYRVEKLPPLAPALVCFLLCCRQSALNAMSGDDVEQEKPLHSSDLEVNGETFNIQVYCSTPGRFFAKTSLGEGDVIITDGRSLPEALTKHENLLPLAISTRELTQSYQGSPRRLKGRRP
jgi:hypothetical protein